MSGDNSALRRRALAAQIVAESQRGGGRRLPTERQLAVDLGVSRSAIRHAMALLQAEGQVSREVGRGTFLRDELEAAIAPDAVEAPEPEARPGADDYAPADVMTVRRLFEPNAMSLVVAWATARDFEEMDRCLRGGERAADHDEFEVWDAALHRSIIAATRSPLLIRLYAEVERARHGRVWGDLKRRSATAARRDEYRRDHEEIVTALRLRDADRATAAMRTHLTRVARHLLDTELCCQAVTRRFSWLEPYRLVSMTARKGPDRQRYPRGTRPDHEFAQTRARPGWSAGAGRAGCHGLPRRRVGTVRRLPGRGRVLRAQRVPDHRPAGQPV